jgi:hypothetical protein
MNALSPPDGQEDHHALASTNPLLPRRVQTGFDALFASLVDGEEELDPGLRLPV